MCVSSGAPGAAKSHGGTANHALTEASGSPPFLLSSATLLQPISDSKLAAPESLPPTEGALGGRGVAASFGRAVPESLMRGDAVEEQPYGDTAGAGGAASAAATAAAAPRGPPVSRPEAEEERPAEERRPWPIPEAAAARSARIFRRRSCVSLSISAEISASCWPTTSNSRCRSRSTGSLEAARVGAVVTDTLAPHEASSAREEESTLPVPIAVGAPPLEVGVPRVDGVKLPSSPAVAAAVVAAAGDALLPLLAFTADTGSLSVFQVRMGAWQTQTGLSTATRSSTQRMQKRP